MTATHRYVVGIDPSADLPSTDIAAFSRYYHDVHAPEVLAANAGFVSCERHELVTIRPGSRPGPFWLAVYSLVNAEAAETYIREQGAGVTVAYTPGPVPWDAMTVTWRFTARLIGQRGGVTSIGDEMTLVGADAREEPPWRSCSQDDTSLNTYALQVNLLPAQVTPGSFTTSTSPRPASDGSHWDLVYRPLGAIHA